MTNVMEERARGRGERRDGGMDTRLADDASVRSPVLINRASHADSSRVLTTRLICLSTLAYRSSKVRQ